MAFKLQIITSVTKRQYQFDTVIALISQVICSYYLLQTVKNFIACHGQLCALRLVQFHHTYFFFSILNVPSGSLLFHLFHLPLFTLVPTFFTHVDSSSPLFTLLYIALHCSYLLFTLWSVFPPVVHSSPHCSLT